MVTRLAGALIVLPRSRRTWRAKWPGPRSLPELHVQRHQEAAERFGERWPRRRVKSRPTQGAVSYRLLERLGLM